MNSIYRILVIIVFFLGAAFFQNCSKNSFNNPEDKKEVDDEIGTHSVDNQVLVLGQFKANTIEKIRFYYQGGGLKLAGSGESASELLFNHATRKVKFSYLTWNPTLPPPADEIVTSECPNIETEENEYNQIISLLGALELETASNDLIGADGGTWSVKFTVSGAEHEFFVKSDFVNLVGQSVILDITALREIIDQKKIDECSTL